MATVSDYIVLSDAAITLVPNPGGGETGEKTLSCPLPDGIDLSLDRQRPVLMFKAWTEGGSINAEVDVNSDNQRNLRGYNTRIEQTIHEVIPRTRLQRGSTNHFRFRVVGGDSNAKLYVSDVILWFQRDGFGPN
jgi:hypothetical protein